MLFNMMPLFRHAEWEGVEKGSKSENLPLNMDFATCGKQGAGHSISPARKGVVCCKIKGFLYSL
jgi:hypothetical protein